MHTNRVLPWRIILSLTAILSFAGCVNETVKEPGNSHPVTEQGIRSILVVPVVNESVEVNAPDYFLSTIVRPLAERGYYIFPVNVVKRVMEDDGLSDAYMVHRAETPRLAGLFGADAVLYVVIKRWDARYALVNTVVTVHFTYTLKSGRTGETLWHTAARMTYSPNSSNRGDGIADLIASVVVAALEKAVPNYLPLTRQANTKAIYSNVSGLPTGPLLPKSSHNTSSGTSTPVN